MINLLSMAVSEHGIDLFVLDRTSKNMPRKSFGLLAVKLSVSQALATFGLGCVN